MANRWSDFDIMLGHAFVPLFPVDSFTPASKCPHKGPLDADSAFVCMVCHASGVDGRPALKIHATDPLHPKNSVAPASKTEAGGERPEDGKPSRAARETKTPTRRQKRAAKFGREAAEA